MAQTLEERFREETQNQINTGFVEIGENNPFIGNTNSPRMSGTIELQPDNSRPYERPQYKPLGNIPIVDGESGMAPNNPKPEYKEITLKFAKGLVGDEFEAKDGKTYREIKIPNADRDDKSPWLSFVARADQIHIDNYTVNGMWLKMPADGHTTVKRDFIVGVEPNGKPIYQRESAPISNKDLKKLMDEVRPREKTSFKDKLSEKRETLAETLARRTKNPINRENKEI
ncbi:MAG: hypothetical protein IKP88_12220 [Lachnospiraceae bacterium]|nr:hypothetical protein [Lachnospiraceae bacterium]